MLAPNPIKRNVAGKAAVWAGVLAVAAIYLFATRPAPLAESQAAGRRRGHCGPQTWSAPA